MHALRYTVFLILFTISSLQATHISIALTQPISYRYAGLIAAIDQGYFKEVGIDVVLSDNLSNSDAVKGVLSAQYDFAIIDNGLNFLMHYPELYMLNNYYAKNSECLVMNPPLMVLNDQSVLLRPDDMADYQMSNIELLLMSMGIAKERIELNANAVVNKKSVVASSVRYDALHINEQHTLHCAHNDVVASLDNALITRKTFASAQQTRMNDVNEAINRGWQYATAHKTAMRTLLLKKYSLDPTDLTKQIHRIEALLYQQPHRFSDEDLNRFAHLLLPNYPNQTLVSMQSYLLQSIRRFDNMQDTSASHIPVVGLLMHAKPYSFVGTNSNIDGFLYQLLQYLKKRDALVLEYELFDNEKALRDAYARNSIDAYFALNQQSKGFKPIIYLQNRLFVVDSTAMHDKSTLRVATYRSVQIPKSLATNQYTFQVDEDLNQAIERFNSQKVDAILLNELHANAFKRLQHANEVKEYWGVTPLSFQVNASSKMAESMKTAFQHLDRTYVDQLATTYFSAAKALSFMLKPEEIRYLQQLKHINYCVKKDRLPLGDIKQGRAVGMGEDLAQLLSFKLNVPFHLVQTTSMAQSIDYVKYKLCDMAMLYDVKRPIDGVKQSDKIISTPFMMVTKNSKNLTFNLASLQKKSLALVQGCPIEQKIRNEFPSVSIQLYDTPKEAMRAVEDNDVYGYVDLALIIEKSLAKTYDGGLNLITLEDIKRKELGVLIRDDQPLLTRIINKSIGVISEQEKRQLKHRWVQVEQDDMDKMKIIYVALAVSALFLLGSVLMYRLFRRNRELEVLKQDVEEKRLALEHRVNEEVAKRIENEKMLYKKERFSSMGEMIGNIAHQWRQPLMSINGILINLEDDFDANRLNKTLLTKRLDEIEEVISHMSQTIEDFRHFFDPNKKLEQFNVKQAIMQAYRLLQSKMSHVNASLELDDDITIEGHRSEFVQIIVALLQNSLDATDSKKSDATLAIVLKRSHGEVIVNVSDNGGGILQENLEKVFDPYFTTKHKFEGTGLGLYISKLIIEHTMSGSLSVQNSESGAVFTITLREKKL